jgi:hypothetical protein
MAGDPKTTIWGLVSSFGTLINASSVFIPPPYNMVAFAAGGAISAIGKSMTSLNTPDVENVVKKDDVPGQRGIMSS